MSSRNSRLFVLLLQGAATVGLSQPSQAAVLLDAPQGNGSYWGMYCISCVAASFTLNASYTVSTIDVVLRTPSSTTFTSFDFSLQDSFSNPTTTFASATVTVPAGAVTAATMSVNKTLLAGTYFLVGNVPGYLGTPVTPGDVDGWLLSTGVYNNAAGTVNNFLPTSPTFRVNGSATSAVPEPSAVCLMLGGLALLKLRRRA